MPYISRRLSDDYKEVSMHKITTAKLVPGMIIARDVYSLDDKFVLPEGVTLTDHTITRLAFYTIPYVYIKDEAELGSKAVPEKTVETSHSAYVKNSVEFQKFSAEFKEDVTHFKSIVNDVVERNAPLDVDLLLHDTLSLLDTARGNIHVFDMLHNLRQYDDLTYTHGLNVALICNVLASWLKLKPEEVELATLCGLLHDIGKLKIPEQIIKKPDRLTDQEYSIIKRHPLEGYKILKKCNVNMHIMNAALMHHERCDGKGYPLGLPAEKIDMYAKIVSIADVYDAMTAARVYRGPLCPFKVIEIFENEGLQKYDTKFIMTFLENVVSTYISNQVRLTDGRIGTVFFINKQALSRPLLKTEDGYIDLMKEPSNISIEAIL